MYNLKSIMLFNESILSTIKDAITTRSSFSLIAKSILLYSKQLDEESTFKYQ